MSPIATPRRALINLSRRLRRHPNARFPTVVVLEGRGDVPAVLNPRRLYQLGEPGKWAIFECPCGSGHSIELNLTHIDRDRWQISAKGPRRDPSVKPSIDYRGSRRCHYWLRNGSIIWV